MQPINRIKDKSVQYRRLINGFILVEEILLLFLLFVVLLSLTACNNSTINSILEQDSQTGFVPSARPGAPSTDEEAAKLLIQPR